MDSEKKAYIGALELRKSMLQKKISELKAKKSTFFDAYYETRAAKLEGEVKSINALIEQYKNSTDTVDVGFLNGYWVKELEGKLDKNKNKQDAVQQSIDQINAAISNTNSKRSIRVLTKMKSVKENKLKKLKAKQARFEKRQRSIVMPRVYVQNLTSYRLGRAEGKMEYNKSKSEDAFAIANANHDGSYIGSIKAAYYEMRGNLYQQSQLKYQEIVDKLKNKITRVQGARTTTVPNPSVAPSLT